MKEQIYTIPINEAFDKTGGCPLCALELRLESDSLDFVTGAAMMEPSVRIETNKQGFCAKHFRDMMAMKNRLSLALMLESHLAEVSKLCFDKTGGLFGGKTDPAKAAAAVSEAAGCCFVCNRMASFMEHYYKNIIYMWNTEQDFRLKFERQSCFCLPHLSALLKTGEAQLGKKQQQEFAAAATKVSAGYIRTLKSDVSAFCKSFDYRNSLEPLTDAVKSSVERAAEFLKGKKV